MQKPNGLTIITPDNLDDCLAKCDLEDACGIGKRIRRRLNKLGIFTLIDLKTYPVGNLIRALGIAGHYWHERLSGNEIDRFEQSPSTLDVKRLTFDDVPKSVGHSFCVPKRANEQNLILPILLRLTERAGRRLRSFGYYARTMTIQANFVSDPLVKGGHPTQRVGLGNLSETVGRVTTVKFIDPANDPFSLVYSATQALEQIWHGEQVTFLAITLSDLVPPNHQLHFPLEKTLFNKEGYSTRRVGLGDSRPLVKGGYSRHGLELGDSIDAIRDRHGEESIIFASMMGLSNDYAPDRIGFRKTEGLDIQVSGI